MKCPECKQDEYYYCGFSARYFRCSNCKFQSKYYVKEDFEK